MSIDHSNLYIQAFQKHHSKTRIISGLKYDTILEFNIVTKIIIKYGRIEYKIIYLYDGCWKEKLVESDLLTKSLNQ